MTAAEYNFSLFDIAESSQEQLNIEDSLQDIAAFENSDAVFECKVESHPPPIDFWYKNGKSLTPDDRIKITTDRHWYRLEISKVKLEDLGVYTLVCMNSTKQFYSKACLYVIPRPLSDAVLYLRPLARKCAVTKHIRSIQVKLGDTIHLDAYFDEVINHCRWFNNSKPVSITRGTMVYKTRNASTLKILNADYSHVGVYFVVATTMSGLLVSSVGSVEVILDATLFEIDTSPSFEEVLPEEVETSEGEEVRLICKAVLPFDTVITWIKDGKPIDKTRCMPEEYGSQYIGLKFSKVSKSDTGEYTVVLSQLRTSKSCSCYLTVVPAQLVVVPPVEVIKPLGHVLACYGARVIFECSFALEDPKYFYVVWYLGRYRVERTNSQFEVVCHGGDFLLYIKSAKPGITGEITCELRKALPKRKSIVVSRTTGNLGLFPPPFIKELSKENYILKPKLCDDRDITAKMTPGNKQAKPQKNGECGSGQEGLRDNGAGGSVKEGLHDDSAGGRGQEGLHDDSGREQAVLEFMYCRVDKEGLHFVRSASDNTDALLTRVRAYNKDGYRSEVEPLIVVFEWKDAVARNSTWYKLEMKSNGDYFEAGYVSSPQFQLRDPGVAKVLMFRVTAVEPIQEFMESEVTIVPAPKMVENSYKNIQIKTMDNFERLYTKTGDLIGSGAFGKVVQVKDDEGEIYAAKIIKTLTQKRRATASREFDIMKKLHHPKVVELIDAFVSKEFCVLVMDYLWGGELFDRIVEEENIKEEDVVPYVRQICEALEYLHSLKIAHLDLKPENIICISPNSGLVKIIDFGLARVLEEGLTTKAIYGTKDYVAPEVLNFEKLTLACDMWSLGVVTYVLLSGVNPFPGDTWPMRSVNITRVNYNYDDVAFDEISDLAKDFVDKLLLLNPNKRMSAKEALDHKWITEGPSKGPKAGFMKKTLENLKSYLANYRARWQRAGNVMIAAHRLRTQAGRTPPASLPGSPRVT